MSTSNTTPQPTPSSRRCPIDFALELFGDRWSLLLIRDMLFRGKRRYSEFLGSEEGISTNILASRLKQMQARGLVEKFADPGNGKASIYLLTDKGVELTPVILEVIRWGMTNDELSAIPQQISQALAEPSVNLTDNILKSIRTERATLQ